MSHCHNPTVDLGDEVLVVCNAGVGGGLFGFVLEKKVGQYKLECRGMMGKSRETSGLKILVDTTVIGELSKAQEAAVDDGTVELKGEHGAVRAITRGGLTGIGYMWNEVGVMPGGAPERNVSMSDVRPYTSPPFLHRASKEDLRMAGLGVIDLDPGPEGLSFLSSEKEPLEPLAEDRLRTVLYGSGFEVERDDVAIFNSVGRVIRAYDAEVLDASAFYGTLRHLSRRTDAVLEEMVTKSLEDPRRTILNELPAPDGREVLQKAVGRENAEMLVSLLRRDLQNARLDAISQQRLLECVRMLRIRDVWNGVDVRPSRVQEDVIVVTRAAASFRCGVDCGEALRSKLLGKRAGLAPEVLGGLLRDRVVGGLEVRSRELLSWLEGLGFGHTKLIRVVLGRMCRCRWGRDVLWEALGLTSDGDTRTRIRGYIARGIPRDENGDPLKGAVAGQYIRHARKAMDSDLVGERKWGLAMMVDFSEGDDRRRALEKGLSDKSVSVRKEALSLLQTRLFFKQVSWEDFKDIVVKLYCRDGEDIRIAVVRVFRSSRQPIPETVLDKMLEDLSNPEAGEKLKDLVMLALDFYARNGGRGALVAKRLKDHLPKDAGSKAGKLARSRLSEIQ